MSYGRQCLVDTFSGWSEVFQCHTNKSCLWDNTVFLNAFCFLAQGSHKDGQSDGDFPNKGGIGVLQSSSAYWGISIKIGARLEIRRGLANLPKTNNVKLVRSSNCQDIPSWTPVPVSREVYHSSIISKYRKPLEKVI